MESKEIQIAFKFRPGLFFGVILMIALFWFVGFDAPDCPIVTRGVSILGFFVFSLAFLLYPFRLLDRRPALVINSKGFYDRASLAGVGLVAWDDMVEIKIYSQNFRGNHQKYLGITLRNPKEFAKKLNPIERWLVNCTASMGYPPVNISQINVGIPLEDLAAKIEALGYFKGRIQITS